MRYKNSDDNRYRVQFMRSTEELMDQLTVKEFISYLEENAEFEDYTVEYIDKKCVKCRAYDLTEENSKLHKEFLVTEDGRVFYWRSLISKIELVDAEEERMDLIERVESYKVLFKECKALEPVSTALAKGYKSATPLQRLEIIRELDTELAEVYSVEIPVITAWVRDDNYVHSTKEIFLGEPSLEGFLHQFRHHLQNKAREPQYKYLLVENDPKADYRIPYKDCVYRMYGEDDARAWARMVIELAS